MKHRLELKQINRKRRRLKAQRRKRMIRTGIGLSLLVAFVFVIRPIIIDNSAARADSAKLLQSQESINRREYAALGTTLPIESQIEAKLPFEAEGYSDQLLSFKRVILEGVIYQEKSAEGKALIPVQIGDYLQFYGHEDGWAKVNFKNTFGYIKTDKLESVEQNYLTVKEGILYTDKDNKIPKDYKANFDVEAENALLIAMEAMRRDGLELSVARKATTFSQEQAYITNKGNYPNPDAYTSELRTGFAVELHSPKTDPRLENNFYETNEGKWVLNNIHKYGFVLRYPNDKENVTGFKANEHIYRYVGIDNAKKMHDNNLVMEEYFK